MLDVSESSFYVPQIYHTIMCTQSGMIEVMNRQAACLHSPCDAILERLNRAPGPASLKNFWRSVGVSKVQTLAAIALQPSMTELLRGDKSEKVQNGVIGCHAPTACHWRARHLSFGSPGCTIRRHTPTLST